MLSHHNRYVKWIFVFFEICRFIYIIRLTNFINSAIMFSSKARKDQSMHKSLYSLMLSDGIVEQIDRLALRENLSRSSMVNKILAEYVSMLTPEMRIAGIFKQIEQAFSNDTSLVPCVTPNSRVMYLKSSLQYKYRPTVRYEVTLFRSANGEPGELSVIFRTQSPELLSRIGEFFILWTQLEKLYSGSDSIRYSVYPDKFVRGIRQTAGNIDIDSLATNISEYVSVFDKLMKYYITSNASADDIHLSFVSQLEKGFKIL